MRINVYVRRIFLRAMALPVACAITLIKTPSPIPNSIPSYAGASYEREQKLKSNPEALPWRVKLSGIKRSKITNGGGCNFSIKPSLLNPVFLATWTLLYKTSISFQYHVTSPWWNYSTLFKHRYKQGRRSSGVKTITERNKLHRVDIIFNLEEWQKENNVT